MEAGMVLNKKNTYQLTIVCINNVVLGMYYALVFSHRNQFQTALLVNALKFPFARIPIEMTLFWPWNFAKQQ